MADPATNEIIGKCPECSVADLERAVSAASTALDLWRLYSGREGSLILRQWYELILENKDDIATLIVWENGKSYADAAGEVLFTASFLDWYSEEAARIYGDIVPHSNRDVSVHVSKEPIGVCALITPWNYPAAMVTRKAAPALAAGCTVIIKTDGPTPYTANATVILIIGCIYLGSSTAFNAFIGTALVLQQCSFALPAALLLWHKRSSSVLPPHRYIRLGPLGWIANAVTVLFFLLILVMYCFPIELPVTGSNMNYTSVVIGIMVIFSAINWFVHAGRKFKGPRLLAEVARD